MDFVSRNNFYNIDETLFYKPKKKRFPFQIFIPALLILGAYGVSQGYSLIQKINTISLPSSANQVTPTPEPNNESVLGTQTKCSQNLSPEMYNKINWYDGNLESRKEFIIAKNEGYSDNKSIVITFNHKELVDGNKSRPDGKDIRVVRLVEGQHSEVPFSLTSLNSVETKLEIKAEQIEISKFYIYYSQKESLIEAKKLESIEQNPREAFSIRYINEDTYAAKLKTNRNWILKNYTKEPLKITFTIPEELRASIVAINYEIPGTDINSAVLEKNEKYEYTIDTNGLNPGDYSIRADIIFDCGAIRTNTADFKLSYPIFVNWTMDWEGYTVNQNFLGQIDTLAKSHNIPITHFFNPRIYITSSINQAAKDQMTNWVKTRETNNADEIGLHLHMWNDAVRAAGVTPKAGPAWAGMNNGYDVIFSSYNKDESAKLAKWGIAELQKHGFTDIISFRVGGWELTSSNLQGLAEAGIKVDSSGRTNHKLGAKLIPSIWKLTPISQPYKPSKSNINETGNDYINLWEFPNNGADSYSYTYAQMKERYDLNYQGGILKEPKVFTLLSHPHWFNIDNPKLVSLFGYISENAFLDDKGPVVYTTIKESYNYWEELY